VGDDARVRDVEPGRVLADLRHLAELTGGPGGSRRLAWTGEWTRAREWLGGQLGEIGLALEADEAGNLWAELPGERDEVALFGSHLDSVPAGGWLDGALGVLAALEVLRACAGTKPPRTVGLVDFADEEGARFGHSLFGSSALAGTLDAAAAAGLRDAEGRRLEDVVGEHGVRLAEAVGAARRRKRLASFLELHIEQGPVLEAEGLPVAPVRGTVGVERERAVFTGEAAHAGSTPMDRRHDAGLAAAGLARDVAEIAREAGGVGTVGAIAMQPGVATAVAGRAEALVDLRHADGEALAAMRAGVHEAAAARAEAEGCTVEHEPIWRIEPRAFDAEIVAAAREVCAAAGGRSEPLTSGALHDAAEVAPHVPTAMLFCPSIRGLSHTPEEDTAEADLLAAVAAYGALARRLIER
jgi:N-carbamoyl-L-amino-acid hydrolase